MMKRRLNRQGKATPNGETSLPSVDTHYIYDVLKLWRANACGSPRSHHNSEGMCPRLCLTPRVLIEAFLRTGSRRV